MESYSSTNGHLIVSLFPRILDSRSSSLESHYHYFSELSIGRKGREKTVSTITTSAPSLLLRGGNVSRVDKRLKARGADFLIFFSPSCFELKAPCEQTSVFLRMTSLSE
ncbi:hypothetical protein BgiBS90_006752 [Biomphalaria glabrata]|nr:hypothetical protein BgiBS90_006752 [Biomphalaria glabrata]